MNHSVTKTFEWSMAHRLIHGYEGKCKNIHGHTYKAEITVEGFIDTKNYGFVIDFGEVSNIMKSWVNEKLDHAMIVDCQDLDMIHFLQQNNQKHFVLPNHFHNSTAENISCLLGEVWDGEMTFRRQVKARTYSLSKVAVWETPTSCATWRKG